jgi:hypothetical protein
MAWPRDVPVEIEGKMDRGFAAMELGGLAVSSARLDVSDGAVKVAFSEPLPEPMDAGGSVWLPDHVNVMGIDGRRGLVIAEDPELPVPTLDLTLEEHVGRFVVID